MVLKCHILFLDSLFVPINIFCHIVRQNCSLACDYTRQPKTRLIFSNGFNNTLLVSACSVFRPAFIHYSGFLFSRVFVIFSINSVKSNGFVT